MMGGPRCNASAADLTLRAGDIAVRKTVIVVLSLWASALLCASLSAAGPRQKPERLQKEIKVSLDYLLYLPVEYDRKGSWPLMLFLHGAGERGDNLNLVKTHGPPKLIEEGRDFPFIVASPQCPRGQTWRPYELSALVDDLVEHYKVDRDRIYVTGLSMGGTGTWALAAYSPNRFAALVPISCTGDSASARRLANVPIWMFNGAKDPGVPVSAARDTVDGLKRRGSAIRFTVYPNAGHDAWTATYKNPELYTWLLSQRRPTSAGKN